MDSIFGIHPKEVDRSTFIPDFPTENMTMNDIDQTLRNCTNMTTIELENMIRRNYHVFLNEKYLTEYEYRKAVINTFSNEEFVKALIKVLSTEILNDQIITCCNKVTWDYMSTSNENTSDNVAVMRKLLMRLSGTVNRQIISLLSAYVPAQLAQMLALSRYSSFKETKNIDRTNYVIYKYFKHTNVQQIVNIYGVLFRTTRLSTVFRCIMYDIDISGLETEEQRENYGLVSTAILEIMEQGMSTADIYIILNSYIDDYIFNTNVVGKHPESRFSLWSINPNDYPRIMSVLMKLKESKTYIP